MMIDMQGIVLADTIQQAERNLLEIDSVDWVEVKAELEPVEFASAFMDREGYLTLAEAVKDFPAFLQKQCAKSKSSQRFLWHSIRMCGELTLLIPYTY